MAWTLTDNLDTYTGKVGPVLRAQPVHYTLQLTLLNTLKIGGLNAFGELPPWFGWWQDPSGDVTAGFMVTPPYPLALTAMPAKAAGALPSALQAADVPVAGVNAEEQIAGLFAARWSELTGARSEVFRRMRLFRLEGLVPPDPAPPGAPRLAAAGDVELMKSWFEAFGSEVEDPVRPEAVDDRLSYQGLMVWDTDAQVVSLAGVTRPVEGVARIGPVYTSPAQRRKGYAAALTAALTQATLDQGVDHMALYTDLANPTSNSIYRQIGYRPLLDATVLKFTI